MWRAGDGEISDRAALQHPSGFSAAGDARVAAKKPFRTGKSQAGLHAFGRVDVAKLEDLCDRWLAAWTGNDPERLLSFYAEGAYYEDPARPEGLRGHDELRPYLSKLLARYPDWTWHRKRLLPVDGGFVLTHEARIPLGGGMLTERAMDLVLLGGDDRITRNEVYFDRAEWMRRLKG